MAQLTTSTTSTPMDPGRLAEVLQRATPRRTALPGVLSDLGFGLVGRGKESSVYGHPDGTYVVKCFLPGRRERAAEEHRLLLALGGLEVDQRLPSGRRLHTPAPVGVVADAGVVMEERVEGVPLETWLQSASADAVNLVADDVLAAAQRSFAVLGHKYGDFNPWNVLVGEDSLILLDPGLPTRATLQVKAGNRAWSTT